VGRAVTFVTCDHTIAALGQVQTIEPTINTDQRSVSIDLDEGDALRCDFFSGPAAAAADTGATEAEVAEPVEETGEGTDPAGETETETSEPEAETTEPETGTTGDTTDAPDAAPETGVFGGGGTDAGTGTGESAAQPANDTTAPDAGSEGTTEESAAGGASELSIQHYACDAPVADATTDDLVERCTASVESSAWALNGDPLEVGDGYAVWDGLAPGTVSVINLAAGGKDDTVSAVYCSIAPVGSEPIVAVEVPVKNGAIELVFDQPAIVYCAWFVAP
jgi:hypothetical protein